MSSYDKTKFYWLQLKEDFFDEDAIDWLEEQQNGKEYSLFYLKLCLKSLRTNGVLIRKVGKLLVPYDHIKLGELTKTNPDTVLIAMNLLMQIGLVEKLENGELYLTQVCNLIGSQSKSAFKKQQQLARKEVNLLENSEGGGKNSTLSSTLVPPLFHPIVENVPPKIEIEQEIELDKEINIERKKNEREEMFEAFWNLYPKKLNRKQCFTAFCNIKGLKNEYPRIIEVLKQDRESEQWQRDYGKFIPYPLTWLHQERWKRQIETLQKENYNLPEYMKDENRPKEEIIDEEAVKLAKKLFN